MSEKLSQDLVLLIIQFCNEEKFKETAHLLERESGLFFDMNYFNGLVLNGEWNEAERYLSGFIKVDDDRFSTKIYFEIRKQKFLEALEDNERMKALEILRNDLKVFAPGHGELFGQMAQLLTMDNFREHVELSNYDQDMRMARARLAIELQRIIKANPILRGKLEFPSTATSRLRYLINQSLNWQHSNLCTHPQLNPVVETLFKDHACPEQNLDNLSPEPAPASASSAISDHSLSTVTDPAVSNGDSCLTDPVQNNNIVPSISDAFSSLSMKECNIESCESVNSSDLPKDVARTLIEESCPSSMDFHPIEHAFLLVGTKVGDIGLWDVNTGEKVFSRNFKVWDIGMCSMIFKISMIKDPNISVNCVAWSPDGSHFAVAFSKNIVQLYSYNSNKDMRQQLEIDAHVGGVNTLAFSEPNKQRLLITGGDDKIIKVWDVVSGVQIRSFSGHEAPIHSICSHFNEGIQFIFSTSVDGQIKSWLYDNSEARLHFPAPGLGPTRMAYSADNKRLFSCGTSETGESFLVEWNEAEGSIKRTYKGLCGSSSGGIVHFDTSRNKLLAAGDDHLIKIWDMNRVELFTSLDIVGGLPQNPLIRFNKEGKLLAVFANENKIMIFSTECQNQSLHTAEIPTLSVDDARRAADDRNKNVCEIVLPFQFRHLRLAPHVKENEISKVIYTNAGAILALRSQISKLIYTNAGNAILALRSNGTHFLWKWLNNELNSDGMATTQVTPEFWIPRGCSRLMTNDQTGSNPEAIVPCLALSKNDSYLMSALGDEISLFNMLTFKLMKTFMPPSPTATCTAFNPQDNNIFAIGMDDSTILIYNARLDKVIARLNGHSSRVTGVAFSTVLGVLVSSGADAQLCSWDSDTWERITNRFLTIPDGGTGLANSDTYLQFHRDEEHFLVVHKTHFAIYEAIHLDCVKQWIPGDSKRISQATFSCDGETVYAGLEDGTVCVFRAMSLDFICRISRTAYNPPSSSLNVCPLSIAAHPTIPTQFAVGFRDGAVIVFEPKNPDDKWYAVPQPDAEEFCSTRTGKSIYLGDN